MQIDKEQLEDMITLFTGLTEHLVFMGKIDLASKTDEEIRNEVRGFARKTRKSPKVEFKAFIDHRTDLLKQARNYFKQYDLEMAIVSYAIWFEHWFNNIISFIGRQQNIDGKEITQIIRTLKFIDKATWFPRLFKIRISPKHLKTLLAVIEIRNTFIHYKWTGENMESWESEEQKFKDVIEKAEKTVTYLRAIENKHIYKNQISRIRKIWNYQASNKFINRTANRPR